MARPLRTFHQGVDETQAARSLPSGRGGADLTSGQPKFDQQSNKIGPMSSVSPPFDQSTTSFLPVFVRHLNYLAAVKALK
jgi:hypothetical protein